MASPVADALTDFAEGCRTAHVEWYLFGAQAALIYGSARLTADIDVTVRLGGVPTSKFVEFLKQVGFEARSVDPGFIDKTSVLPLVHRATALPVDVVLAGPGIEDRFLERARSVKIGGQTIPVALPEDLVAMKILAGRPKDMEDVVAILNALGSSFDPLLTRETLRLLQQALDQSDLLPAFEQALAEAKSA